MGLFSSQIKTQMDSNQKQEGYPIIKDLGTVTSVCLCQTTAGWWCGGFVIYAWMCECERVEAGR